MGFNLEGYVKHAPDLNDRFRIVKTEDGSPSLEWTDDNGYFECMHSRLGAYSETLFIYSPILENLSENFTDPASDVRVISVGLGMGYVECLWACFCITKQRPNWQIESYEKDAFLRSEFVKWINGEPTPVDPAYNEMAALFSKTFDVSTNAIRAYLSAAHKDGRWVLKEELNLTTQFDRKFHGLFFDPFSNKATPELWTPDFLSRFFSTATEDACVFSTYAATGELKRQLRQNGFVLVDRRGFGGKRESTFAARSLNVAVPSASSAAAPESTVETK